jgi:hypothetical protein
MSFTRPAENENTGGKIPRVPLGTTIRVSNAVKDLSLRFIFERVTHTELGATLSLTMGGTFLLALF